MNILSVMVGGAIGASLRYLVSQWLPQGEQRSFPWATFIVNVIGSLILGVISGGTAIPVSAALAMGTGFCGALTTFSTFGFETVDLVNKQKRLHATIYVATSVIIGLVAAVIGWTVGAEFVNPIAS